MTVGADNTAAVILGFQKLVRRFGRAAVNARIYEIANRRRTRGRLRKKQNNGSLGGAAPYGYCVVGSGRNSRLKKVPKELKVVGKILFWHRKDLSAWEIMKKLNAKGFRNRNGKPFECYQVARILDRAQAIDAR